MSRDPENTCVKDRVEAHVDFIFVPLTSISLLIEKLISQGSAILYG